MNRSLLVQLLKKNIDELILLTEGFTEMSSYPQALIHLAKNKTNDIHQYLEELGNISEIEQPIVGTAPSQPTTLTPANEPEMITDEVEVESDSLELKDDENEDVLLDLIEDEEEEEEQIEEEEEEEQEDEEELEEDLEEEEEEEEKEEVLKTVDEEEIEEEIEEEDDDDVDEEDEVDEDEVEIEEEVLEKVVEAPEIISVPVEPTEVKNDIQILSSEIAEVKSAADKPMTLAERMSQQSVSRNDAHAKPQNGGMHAAMSGKKVDDIRQAISLGDRFRFQRELFRNNGEEMNKMLGYINQLATYEEVISFLQSKYGWPADNVTADDFYQIIKRKFL